MMRKDPWLEAIEKLCAAMSQRDWPPADEVSPPDTFSFDETTLCFAEQIARGSWPVRVPMVLEIYAEGTRPRIRAVRRGEQRCKSSSQIVTVYLEFDRAKVREMMLEQIRAPRTPASSKLPHLLGLVRVDRECFLETAAAHFVETLADGDEALRHDPWFVEFLREQVDYDADLIGELIAATIRTDRTAGRRLRDVITERTGEPQVCEYLGWLAAARLGEQLQELRE